MLFSYLQLRDLIINIHPSYQSAINLSRKLAIDKPVNQR